MEVAICTTKGLNVYIIEAALYKHQEATCFSVALNNKGSVSSEFRFVRYIRRRPHQFTFENPRRKKKCSSFLLFNIKKIS